MLTRKFTVIPAIDLLGDDAVRLEQGDFDGVLFRRDPLALAERLAAAGPELVHVVDLDGARSERARPELVARLARAVAPAGLQASGGIRSLTDAEQLLAAGADRVVVGTAAFADDGALERFVAGLGERLVVAIDVRAGRVAVHGWERDGGITPEEAAARCRDAGVARILCTAIERDGTLGGPDLDLLRLVREASGLPVLAAGGVRSQEDLDSIEAAGCEGAVVGRALAEGVLPLAVLSRGGR